MLEDIEQIRAFIGSKTAEEFTADTMCHFAVAYAFVRLGEAVSHVPQHIRAEFAHIEWRDVRHFRNFMVHVYHEVDAMRLYQTAMTSLPPLESGLKEVLNAYPI